MARGDGSPRQTKNADRVLRSTPLSHERRRGARHTRHTCPVPSSFRSPRATALRGAGELRTPHGDVQTPAFMPVGTRGAVKSADPPRPRRPRRRDHPRQHLSPVSQAGRRTDRAGRRAAPFHRLGSTDPDRQRRLPDLQPRRSPANLGRGRRVPIAPRRLAPPADAGIAPPTSSCSSAPTSRWCSTSALRRPRDRGHHADGDGALDAVGEPRAGALAPDPRATPAHPDVPGDQHRTGAVRHHPGRHASRPSHRERAGARSRSASRPTRSAGSSVGEPPNVMYEVVAHTAAQLPDDSRRDT